MLVMLWGDLQTDGFLLRHRMWFLKFMGLFFMENMSFEFSLDLHSSEYLRSFPLEDVQIVVYAEKISPCIFVKIGTDI